MQQVSFWVSKYATSFSVREVEGQDGSHSEPKPVLPPLPNKCDWEIDPVELDFTSSRIVRKGSFGEIVKASWCGTPAAVKRILPSLSDYRFVVQDFRHEVNLLVKLGHPNIVQFLGAVTEKKPLMLIIEFLRGGDLHHCLKVNGALNPTTAIKLCEGVQQRVLAIQVFELHILIKLLGLLLFRFCFCAKLQKGHSGQHGKVSYKTFGVVLLELITSRISRI
ncbi:hypothetical protein L1987_35137 [Smallanthus sonchifolius]|uniref:Uncharacterized protein n=1 Tax=Smallanthus sonchifolius TaxID=185202 RepID=A0ACB9HWY7_9ASTR|nr:hypothetical protein L1987_35137 [Smallanthus sonchifolius]